MITVKFSETVTQSGVGVTSVITQTYTASVQVSLIDAGPGAWSLAGPADIAGTFTSDYESRTTSSLGPCNVHYTDDASGSTTVQIDDGGLEASDGFYQFFVSIPGFEGGSNNTVRDDSGCFGPNNRETTPWAIAPSTPGGSGEYTDAGRISGSSSEPREGGEYTITWDFTLP